MYLSSTSHAKTIFTEVEEVEYQSCSRSKRELHIWYVVKYLGDVEIFDSVLRDT